MLDDGALLGLEIYMNEVTGDLIILEKSDAVTE
jgi:hypothetical protein